MRRRVFVIAGEYSANPRYLLAERRSRAYLSEPHPDLPDEEVARLFFRFPNRSEDGRATPDDWRREFGLDSPIGLPDLFASAAHRSLTSLYRLIGGEYEKTREAITHLFVTSMPGLDPNERMNIGLVPQGLRAVLRLPRRVVAQYVVGTSDSGAWAFAQAVRAARDVDRPMTILVVAGQIVPSGYASQYQIRTVLGEADQARGLDMLGVGDLLMDSFRRNLGLTREEVEQFLSRLAARKFLAGGFYPSGIAAGRPFKRIAPRTPYFDASDIAAPCCGAAATIVTSDEELAMRAAGFRGTRYRAAPVTEVLAVGEGSSSANVLHRPSPLMFATAVREALMDTAEDARLPLSAFSSGAFGVVHDAFPSIELTFLLSMGLSWERSAERMIEGWSNPFGGLLTFGHALGASGLVQVNKAHHLFCGDQRYLKEGPTWRRLGFQSNGAPAFATSVGGPLSHIVVGFFHGGFAKLPTASERELNGSSWPVRPAPGSDWRSKRPQVRRVVHSYLRRLEGRVPGKPWFIEGVSYVSVRSALRALSTEDIARLTFDGLERWVVPERLEEVREQLREVVRVVLGEAERVASMFDAFRLLADEVRALSKTWRSAGFLSPRAVGMTDSALTDRVKECLRVPFAMLYGPSGNSTPRRHVLFLPVFDLTYEKLNDVDVISSGRDGKLSAVASDPMLLPFWSARASRPADEAKARRKGSASELVEQILEGNDGLDSAAELKLLQTWFAPDPARPLLQRALREVGSELEQPEAPARAVVYRGEVADGSSFDGLGASQELFGRAAKEASVFLEPYETTMHQAAEILTVAAFERPPFHSSADEAMVGVARFAQEVARAALEHGIVIRAAICPGEGAVFEDTSGRPNLASPGYAQATKLLAKLRAGPAGPALAIYGAAGELLERIKQRLEGWELEADAELGCAIWRGPVPVR